MGQDKEQNKEEQAGTLFQQFLTLQAANTF